MRERWQASMNPVAVEDHTSRVVHLANGEVRRDANLVFTEDQMQRLRDGYVCCVCYRMLDQAFPEKCPDCGFPMRKEQASRVESEFEGTTWVGPSRETIERLQTPLPQANPQGAKSGIWVPRGVSDV